MQPATGTVPDPIIAAVQAEQLRQHASSMPAALLANLLVALLMLAMVGPASEIGLALAWLVALGVAMLLRLRVRRQHRREPGARSGGEWLARYRAGALLHGLVWGAAALLPGSIGEPVMQVMLTIILAGLAVGNLTLTQFDLRAALCFAIPAIAPLALRLLAAAAPVPQVIAVTGAMITILLGVFTILARRAHEERLALARARAAESQGAEGAHQAQALLKIIFEHAGEGICVFDAGHRLLAANQRFADYTGLAGRRLEPGVDLQELMTQAVAQGAFGRTPAAAEGELRLAELLAGQPKVVLRRRPDGSLIETRSNPLPGGGFIAVLVDVTQRHESEQALAAKQHMLELLLQNTEQGFWFVDNEQRTTDTNPAMCRMLGRTREQMLGRKIYEFVDADNEAIFRHHAALRDAGVSGSYEIALQRSDGMLVHTHNNGTPIFDDAGVKIGAVGLFSDISASKRAAAQIRHTGELLEQKSRMLESTLQSLSQGVLGVDPEGRVNAWNRRLLDLLEIPESLLQSRPTLSELAEHQIRAGHFGEQLERMDEGGREGLKRFTQGDTGLLALQYQRTRLDGTVIEVQSHISSDGSLVRTYTDVTSDVAAQRSLRESESRFRTLADGAPALIWLSDGNGQPLWFNQRWQQFTGRSVDEEVKCAWDERIHPDDQARYLAQFQTHLQTRRAFENEYRLVCSDGKTRWIADSAIPRFGPGMSFEGYVIYGWDITDRQAEARALMAAKDEAERANRAKSEFLSRMSHELRTPMNAILGFGQLLLGDEREPLTAGQRGRVQELLRGGHHLLDLINEVLDLARIEAGTLQLQRQPVALESIVDECLRLVQPVALERGITLTPPTSPALRVLADPTRLRQVLLNLLSNAIKYNREGGRVDLAWHAQGRRLRIEVHDTGPGVSAAQQQRLFQVFERLEAGRSAVQGAGIGLALSKWLVNLMQGEIGVDSEPGAGSTFWVDLEMADGAAEPPVAATAAPVAPAAEATLPHKTVLYIEDNAVNQILMEGMLAHRPGVRLLLAGLPGVGLTMAAQARPDLVLLDIQLPEMDGFEVLRRLRAMPAMRGTPVVAVSANAMDGDIAAARAAGFDDYLTKPLEMQRLLAVVDRKLRGA